MLPSISLHDQWDWIAKSLDSWRRSFHENTCHELLGAHTLCTIPWPEAVAPLARVFQEDSYMWRERWKEQRGGITREVVRTPRAIDWIFIIRAICRNGSPTWFRVCATVVHTHLSVQLVSWLDDKAGLLSRLKMGDSCFHPHKKSYH